MSVRIFSLGGGAFSDLEPEPDHFEVCWLKISVAVESLAPGVDEEEMKKTIVRS